MKKGKILKKLMFVLSVGFGLMLGSAWVSSFAEETTVNGIKYNYDPSTQTASVSTEQNTSISGNLNIPSSIEVDSISYAVTLIEDSAFENCIGITDVTIWFGIERIGKMLSKIVPGCPVLHFRPDSKQSAKAPSGDVKT